MTPQRAGEVKCTPRQCEEMPLHFFFLFFLAHTHCTVARSLVIWAVLVTFLKSFFPVSVKSSQLLSQQTRGRSYRLVHMRWNCVCVCLCTKSGLRELRKIMPQLSSVAQREHMYAKKKKKKNHTLLRRATFSHGLDVFIHSALFCYILIGLFAPGKHFQHGTKQQWFEGNTAHMNKWFTGKPAKL